jgi:hypothetical protein
MSLVSNYSRIHLKTNKTLSWQKNYFEPNKVILVKWMDKALQQSLKKEKRNSWFKIHGI